MRLKTEQSSIVGLLFLVGIATPFLCIGISFIPVLIAHFVFGQTPTGVSLWEWSRTIGFILSIVFEVGACGYLLGSFSTGDREIRDSMGSFLISCTLVLGVLVILAKT